MATIEPFNCRNGGFRFLQTLKILAGFACSLYDYTHFPLRHTTEYNSSHEYNQELTYIKKKTGHEAGSRDGWQKAQHAYSSMDTCAGAFEVNPSVIDTRSHNFATLMEFGGGSIGCRQQGRNSTAVLPWLRCRTRNLEFKIVPEG